VYTPQRITEEYGGLTPEQLIDVKALQGDSSDNIPGVPGIGPKIATMLIAKYGSLEKMYDAIEHTPESGKLQEKLMNGKDSAFFSQKLGTIIRDVPLGIELDDLLPMQPDFETVYDILMAYDLKSLARDWGVEPEFDR
jgi:DNA polymerase-1